MKRSLLLAVLSLVTVSARAERYREINGVVYDFGPALEWQKKAEDFKKMTPPSREAGQIGSTAYEFQQKQLDAERAKWAGYVVTGRVDRVISEGFLVNTGTQQIILKNHPQGGTLGEGSTVNCLAMPAGQFDYKAGPKKKKHKLSVFDCGKAVAAPAAKAVPLPPFKQ